MPHYTPSDVPRRYRPSRRVARSDEQQTTTALTEEFSGLAVSYGDTLLFIGYEVDGGAEILIYRRYRFSSDERVQGYLGYLWVPYGTPWEEILDRVNTIEQRAQQNYRVATSLRASELRAHGSRYEAAYDAITEAFRESWHGLSVRLRREGNASKDGVIFSGHPPGPVLAEWRGGTYTVMVFPTGSILVLTGDPRSRFET